MSWLNQKHPKLAESVAILGKVVFTDGALSRKTKELIAVAISAVVRCEPCLESHVRRARELGASEEEIAEALGVGLILNGTPVRAWSAKKLSEIFQK